MSVETLGPVRVVRDGEEVSVLRARPLQLSLLLLVAVERELTRDMLLGSLWGDREQDRASHSLSQTLYQLKGELGDRWLNTRGRLVRATEALEADLLEFQSAVDAGDRERALALYGGPFLEGFISDSPDFSHWAAGKRARVERARRALMREEIDVRVAAGDEAGALTLARSWVESDPLEDEGQHRVIELLAASGRRREALHQYERFRNLLDRDGLEPLEETRALVARIRSGEVRASASGLAPHPPPVSPSEEPGKPEEPERQTRVLGGLPVSGPRLVRLTEGGREAEAYVLRPRKTVIGRTTGDISFPDDDSLASPHATIFVRSIPDDPTAGSRYVLRDEGSEEGVFLRIRSSWPLRDGNEFAVGRQRFRYRVATGPEGPPRAG